MRFAYCALTKVNALAGFLFSAFYRVSSIATLSSAFRGNHTYRIIEALILRPHLGSKTSHIFVLEAATPFRESDTERHVLFFDFTQSHCPSR
jgi:hypothetical protein